MPKQTLTLEGTEYVLDASGETSGFVSTSIFFGAWIVETNIPDLTVRAVQIRERLIAKTEDVDSAFFRPKEQQLRIGFTDSARTAASEKPPAECESFAREIADRFVGRYIEALEAYDGDDELICSAPPVVDLDEKFRKEYLVTREEELRGQ